MIRFLIRAVGIRPDPGLVGSQPRSPRWPAWLKKFLVGKVCVVCERNDEPLTGHHVVPFHVDPSREMDPTNVEPVCDDSPTRKCHLLVGHLGDWRLENKDFRAHAATLREARRRARSRS